MREFKSKKSFTNGMKSTQTVIKTALLALLVTALLACAPRGESIPVEQVYANARTRFSAAVQSGQELPEPVRNQLTELVKSVEELQSNPGTTAAATKIATILQELTPQAGYTSRPSLTALTKQLEELGSSAEATSATRTLLAARVLAAASAELESTRFGV